MKKVVLIMLFLLTGCAASVMHAREKAFVTEVIDGDTIVIEGGARVRILGVNAPERGEKGYKEAKQFLEKLVLDKEVVLERDGANIDRYDRLLRHVWMNNTLVAEVLVREGLARAKYFEKEQKYREQIAMAERQAKQGLWR